MNARLDRPTDLPWTSSRDTTATATASASRAALRRGRPSRGWGMASLERVGGFERRRVMVEAWRLGISYSLLTLLADQESTYLGKVSQVSPSSPLLSVGTTIRSISHTDEGFSSSYTHVHTRKTKRPTSLLVVNRCTIDRDTHGIPTLYHRTPAHVQRKSSRIVPTYLPFREHLRKERD